MADAPPPHEGACAARPVMPRRRPAVSGARPSIMAALRVLLLLLLLLLLR